MKTFEGKLVSQNIKIGIVAARFNEFITSKLLSGAMDGLLRHDIWISQTSWRAMNICSCSPVRNGP